MLKVVVVGVEGEANLGFIIRLCRNFDVDELALVSPIANVWSDEVKRFAANGIDFLHSGKVKIYQNLEDSLKDVGVAACTSSVVDTRGGDVLRKAIELEDFVKIASSYSSIAVVFGRESVGLTREEISKCHILVHIASNPEYPVLNLSHAVAIILYELYKALKKPSLIEKIDRADEESLKIAEKYIDLLAKSVASDERQYEMFSLTLKRLIRKTSLSKAEIGFLVTFIRRLANKVQRQEHLEV
ncbi:MAG: TrmH family RNA methyltransferase [Ignisphaera sp.]